jgi:hypothetical protein
VEEHLLNICKALGWTPNNQERKERRKEGKKKRKRRDIDTGENVTRRW